MGVLEDDKVCNAYAYTEKIHDDIESIFLMGVKRLPSIDKPANFADLYACSTDTYYSTPPTYFLPHSYYLSKRQKKAKQLVRYPSRHLISYNKNDTLIGDK
jgi:hypothetical protein